MFFHESDRGDTGGFAFFGNGNKRFFLLVVELVHHRGKRAAFLFQDVAQRFVNIVHINHFIGINIGKSVV